MIAMTPSAVMPVMPSAVVAVMPTAETTLPATMPAVPATMPAVPATGVSLACHRQARDRDCHAADNATKSHEGMSHKEIQPQPPAGASACVTQRFASHDSSFPNPQRRMKFAPWPHRSEVIDLTAARAPIYLLRLFLGQRTTI